MANDKQNAAFIDAAHALSHAAPEQWAAFMSAFHIYAVHKCVEAVQAHTDQTHVAKGHAQGVLHLHDTLSSLEARYRAIHNKR